MWGDRGKPQVKTSHWNFVGMLLTAERGSSVLALSYRMEDTAATATTAEIDLGVATAGKEFPNARSPRPGNSPNL